MFKKYLLKLKTDYPRALREQKGQSIIIFTFAVLGLIAMMGLALDLGLVYIERVRINRATDAATLAAVVELPYEEDTINRAVEYLQLNGYNVGQDVEVLVRGCVDPGGGASLQNVSEDGLLGTGTIAPTNLITGFTYIPATQLPPRAKFVIDTGAYQAPGSTSCAPVPPIFGTANKLKVAGQVNVRMNFMQFFGFVEVPVQDEAIAENVTSLDVVVVFDVSGSMEYETTCYDCWIRTSYDPDYPNNGYFNPLPYSLAISTTVSGPGVNQSIPNSALCTQPVTPHTGLGDGFSYLVHEAELYSSEEGDWRLDVRTPGQGFWVLQRGSRSNSNSILELDGSTNNEGDNQGNQAGNIAGQSSNVCGDPGDPATFVPGIDCQEDLGGGPAGHICKDDPGSGDIAIDCSAYIKAHPYPTYSQSASNDPSLQGAAYNIDCFSSFDVLGRPNGACWNNPNAPIGVPWVEYDYTPTWTGNAHIWIRARGGGDRAYEWNGPSPSSLTAYRDTIFWQIDSGPVQENSSVSGSNNGWRDNRATDSEWQWVKLGSTAAISGTQYTLKLYQGSAGYKVDKIVFTNNSTNSINNLPWGSSAWGPRATNGSATREACNQCNPAFGYTVGSADCSCQNGPPGTENSCTTVVTTTNQLVDDLYNGLDPLRSAQEAVKNFAKRMDPKFDQLGIVAFTTNTVNGAESRSKLQCLNWAAKKVGDSAACYDPAAAGGAPISYTNVIKAVERQWPQGGTDIAEGLREGLEILGITGYANNSNCDLSGADEGINNKSACDRRGAARRIIVLLTDGSPKNNPGNCAAGGGRPDLWNGEVGNGDPDYECTMYYGWQAAQNGIIVYTIGLGAGVNSDLLNAIATGTDPHGEPGEGDDESHFTGRGGQFYAAVKPTDLDAIFAEILANIYVRIVG